MRGLFAEMGVLLLAIGSVAFALVPSLRTRSRTVLVLTAVAAVALTIFQYYLVAYTGRGLFERAACVVFPGGSFCRDEPGSPVREPESVYRSLPPQAINVGEIWGRFHVDQNCDLRFGNGLIQRLGSGEQRCEITPRFSPSPSGRFVAVNLNTPGPGGAFGFENLSVVDTLAGQVLRPPSLLIENGNGFEPLDAWSTDESLFLLKRWISGGPEIEEAPGWSFYQLWGEAPCTYAVTEDELECPPDDEFWTQVAASAGQASPITANCLRRRGCHLILGIDNASANREGGFNLNVRVHVTRRHTDDLAAQFSPDVHIAWLAGSGSLHARRFRVTLEQVLPSQ